jgi:transcriptional regulator with XRE-family HTH domain
MYNQDLKSVREAKRLTQMDLSEISGLPQSHIAKIENGQLLPRKATRVKIERLLGSEISWQATLDQDRDHIWKKRTA